MGEHLAYVFLLLTETAFADGRYEFLVGASALQLLPLLLARYLLVQRLAQDLKGDAEVGETLQYCRTRNEDILSRDVCS